MTEKDSLQPEVVCEFIDKSENGGDCNWSNFSQWFHCMCVVTFDLNLGQALEYVYPPQNAPTETEMSNICYLAFPDSNSSCMGDTKFHIRLRQATESEQFDKTLKSYNNSYHAYNNDCLPLLRADPSHYWGFVYFRQRRDATLPRGYFQKSFILVTRLPYFKLYFQLLDQIAQLYFDEGIEVLHKACQQIDVAWPKLSCGMPLLLPLFDTTYEIELPKSSSARKSNFMSTDLRSEHKNTQNVARITQVHELELFRSLNSIVDNLYTLWELVLTAEPIVVVGNSPADCSQMIQTLVALIQPLEYSADARPYFTIHDSEFKEFTSEFNKTPPSVLLGVTNPYFVKLLKNWPHILRLDTNQKQLPKSAHELQTVTSFNNTSSTAAKNGKNNIYGSDASSPGLHTKYKPFLKKDKSLIKKVLLGMKVKRPDNVQTALLRRHLLELTQSFMIPLERYVASLMPLQKDISPFKSAPNAHAFKLDDFLATLELSGPQLTSPLKGDWKGLYKRFFNSPNFRCWYQARRLELQNTLQDLQLDALSKADLEHWARDKQEVEIIDMILKLKQKLYTNSESRQYTCEPGQTTRQQILAQIECMKQLLPQDLRNVVNI